MSRPPATTPQRATWEWLAFMLLVMVATVLSIAGIGCQILLAQSVERGGDSARVASAAEPGGRLVLLRGGENRRAIHAEISGATRAAIQRDLDAYVRDHGWYQPAAPTSVSAARLPGLYTFFPMAGRFGRDVFPRNMVDVDPGGGAILDFTCGAYTYDGHLGIDVTIRSFAEKDLGVPVYAARDGVVVRTDDGHYDENGGGTPVSTQANHVVIDHGNQQIAYYWHLKNGSVLVQAGDAVVAGQQIGSVAASGWANWPHLHFETQVAGTAIEPSAGPCNPGLSGWTTPIKLKKAVYLDDFAFSHAPPSSAPEVNLPWDMPRTGQIALDDPVTYFWFQVKSLPAGAPWRAVFRRPDGSVAHEESANFGGGFNRGTWYLFGFDVEDMHRIVGTWELDFFIDGQRMGTLPVDVVSKRSKKFNRPPARVKARFEPRRPRAHEVVACQVKTDLLLDDPDYDVVRFRYEWRVNDRVVRDVVSAAHSDVLQRGSFARGDRVECTVTPDDGRLAGPPRSVRRKAR